MQCLWLWVLSLVFILSYCYGYLTHCQRPCEIIAVDQLGEIPNGRHDMSDSVDSVDCRM